MLRKLKIFSGVIPRVEIFVRHCNYSSISSHKKRFVNFSKEKCLENLLQSLERKDANVTFLLDTFHPMKEEHFLYKQKQWPIHAFNAGSETASFLYMLEYVSAKKFSPDTIVYFLEDDYLHKLDWIQVLREAFTLQGVDYVTLYDHGDKYFFPQYANLQVKIFHTNSCHWRVTPSTTNTYAMRYKTLKNHMDIHRHFSLDRTITADHEKFMKLAEVGAVLISSMPGYSTHAEPDYASPCTSWENLLLP